jgi:hypothetical protein
VGSTPRLRRRTVWALRIFLLLFVPALFCALVEAGLRLAGVGHPTAFFVKQAIGPGYIPNDQFGRPFGCREVGDLFVLPAVKPAGHIHIFVLGESADQLRRYVDLPWCRADEFYIQKLALVLRSEQP